MRKALRIIAISSAVVSLVATIVLGFIYFEDIIERFKAFSAHRANRILIDNDDE